MSKIVDDVVEEILKRVKEAKAAERPPKPKSAQEETLEGFSYVKTILGSYSGLSEEVMNTMKDRVESEGLSQSANEWIESFPGWLRPVVTELLKQLETLRSLVASRQPIAEEAFEWDVLDTCMSEVLAEKSLSTADSDAVCRAIDNTSVDLRLKLMTAHKLEQAITAARWKIGALVLNTPLGPLPSQLILLDQFTEAPLGLSGPVTLKKILERLTAEQNRDKLPQLIQALIMVLWKS
jgi:hypothetical protein